MELDQQGQQLGDRPADFALATFEPGDRIGRETQGRRELFLRQPQGSPVLFELLPRHRRTLYHWHT